MRRAYFQEVRVKNMSIVSQDIPKKEDNSFTNPLWTVADVASYLRLKTDTVRGMVRRGELPGIKVGRVWRFKSDSIKNRFLENSTKD